MLDSDCDCVSSVNMADVRPVRQPWSRCVAHQSSLTSEVSDADADGEVGGDAGVGAGVGK